MRMTGEQQRKEMMPTSGHALLILVLMSAASAILVVSGLEVCDEMASGKIGGTVYAIYAFFVVLLGVVSVGTVSIAYHAMKRLTDREIC